MYESRLCAFLMYTMWWHKPLSPNEPLILKGDWVEPLCAYMYMSSEMSGDIDMNSLRSQTAVKTMLASLRLYSKEPEMKNVAWCNLENHVAETAGHTPTAGSAVIFNGVTHASHDGVPSNSENRSGLFARMASRQSLELIRSTTLDKAAATAFFERRPRVKAVNAISQSRSETTAKRWALAASAIDRYPILREQYTFKTHHDGQCTHFRSEELLVRRVQNWPWDDLLRDVGGLVVGLILWLANFVYGAIHAAAWAEHFPTNTEKWLWRSCSAYIGFCGGLWVVLNYAAQAYRPLNEFWERWMDGGGRRWQHILLGVPVVVCGASLIFARGFIVVEAFLSIRSLPAAAYDTPSWSQVFPHL